MDIAEEKHIRIESAAIAVKMVLKELNLFKDDISQNEAFRIAGSRALFQTWLNLKLIKGIPGKAKNSKRIYSRIEVETLTNLHKQGKLKY